jgi:hypothetical protein
MKCETCKHPYWSHEPKTGQCQSNGCECIHKNIVGFKDQGFLEAEDLSNFGVKKDEL